MSTPTQKLSAKDWFIRQVGYIGPLPVILVAAIIFFSIVSPVFATPQNLLSVLQQSIFLLLMALGQLMILITGGFDLSVSANVSMVSVLSAMVMVNVFGGDPANATVAVLVSLLVALALGALVGLINGLGVSILRINAFIVTLAVATIVGGATLLISRGTSVIGLPEVYRLGLGGGTWLGVPTLVWLTIPVVVLLFIITNNSVYGNKLYAVGDNPAAAQVAGIWVKSVTVSAYIIGAMLVALAAWLLTARIGSGQPTMGGTFTMTSITAAIIGGASLRGGRGTVLGVVMGVLFLQILSNGMNLMKLDSNTQEIAIGVALLFAVLIDRIRDRARAHSAATRRLTIAQDHKPIDTPNTKEKAK